MKPTTETSQGTSQAVVRINAHLDALSERFVSRRALLELVFLGLISREHVLLIGPPGTGKSATVQAIAASFDATSFEYLIGRFTEPSELFGALDLNALKEGRIQPVTSGMLPQADIAFLDEIFLGSTAILNSLLKILNERTYRRGQFSMTTPLISCIAASNAMPDDTALAAFADRFLLTMFVDPVGDDELTDLLRSGWQTTGETAPTAPVSKAEIAQLHQASLQVDMSEVHDAYAHIVRKIRLTGVIMSDRKIVKGQKLVAASALLRGWAVAGPEDLWPITYLVQSKAQQAEIRELLHAELKESRNPVLTNSVAHATYGPTAHAAYLGDQASALLDSQPDPDDASQREIWLVRLETMLTRIDAGFDAKTLPQHLGMLRSRVAAVLEANSSGNAADAPTPEVPATSEVA